MGGELRPELQASIFSDTYPAGTEYHQDFNLCTEVTHATYSLNYHAFATGYSGNDLTRAKAANHRMGYSFLVTKVDASVGSDSSNVDISVTVNQTGVAPFYYPLHLNLRCTDGTSSVSKTLPNVETIINEGDGKLFAFTNIPATQDCLNQLEISLSSDYTYIDNPVKFAQGTDGTTVSVSVPLPPAPCTLAQIDESCLGGSDCCSGLCSGGKPSNRVCLANGPTAPSPTPPPPSPTPPSPTPPTCAGSRDPCNINGDCCTNTCKKNGRCD
eukprot:9338608-Ditylum_brightwellii.AAC.1